MIHLKTFNESLSQKTIVTVDIQETSSKYLNFSVYRWLKYLVSEYQKGNEIIFLYNGSDFNITENDYVIWLTEQGDYEEEIIKMLDNSTFVDKIYAFFRPLSEEVDDDKILEILELLKKRKLHTTQDLSDTDRKIYSELDEYGDIWIPSELHFLENIYNEILLMGGHKEYCLKEIRILLDFYKKDYSFVKEFCYD